MKNSFVLYTEIIDVVMQLSNEQKGLLFQAILDYQNGKEPDLSDPIVRIAFTPIKQTLDRNNKKWELERQKRSDAGKKGMAKRWGKITNDNSVITPITNDKSVIPVITNDNTAYQDITKITVNANANVNANVNENVNVIESRGKTRAFTPPSLEEVSEYCSERKNHVNAQTFIDFYTSKGWMIGKSKMRDWKAAVRTWERRETKDNKVEVEDFFKRELGYD